MAYIGKEDTKDELSFSINFLTHRYHSKWVKAEIEPNFNSIFYFDLQPKSLKSLLELEALLKLATPIEMVLLKKNSKGEKEILSLKQIEWRFALHKGRFRQTLELNTIGKHEGTVGVFDVGIEMIIS